MGLPQLSALDWGLVALVAFPLLQLPLVFYLSRYVESDEEPIHGVEFHDGIPNDPTEAPQTHNRDRDRVPSGARSRDARTVDPRPFEPSTIACPACGTENDPAFTFCGSCVARLSGVGVAHPTPPR